MSVSRMRMRPWLEDMIDSNSIAGLVWVDKVRKKKMFSIPWKHSAHHGWDIDKDPCLFKQWAILTGKFKPGITEPDPKTWKANFRCAMNSLPDIEKVKDESINKGCEAAFVYRMLQVEKNKNRRSSTSQESRRRKKVRKIDADMEETEEHLYTHKQQDTITQENTIDSTDGTHTPSPTYDVPDCSGYEVEIGPDSTNDIYIGRFQVSPVHTTECEEKAIVEITRQLELDSSQWLQSSSSGKAFLCNEEAMTESYQRPESQWSDSSGEELELRFYTELIPGLPSEELLSYTDMWNSNPHTTGLPQITFYSKTYILDF